MCIFRRYLKFLVIFINFSSQNKNNLTGFLARKRKRKSRLMQEKFHLFPVPNDPTTVLLKHAFF